MIRVDSLCTGYRRRKLVLRSLSLQAVRGEITVLLGANGSGKSTLLKTLGGLLPARAGEIYLDGQPLSSLSPRALASRVAFMPQSRPTPDLTAAQLLGCARYPHTGLSRPLTEEDRAAVARAAALCGIDQ